jgi:hypothetical protein
MKPNFSSDSQRLSLCCGRAAAAAAPRSFCPLSAALDLVLRFKKGRKQIVSDN